MAEAFPGTKVERELIAEAIATFPAEFGLQGCPGKVFRIEESACYWDCGMYLGKPDHEPGPMLYVYINTDGEWMSFAKGQPDELRLELRPAPNSEHRAVTNHYSLTDGDDRLG